MKNNSKRPNITLHSILGGVIFRKIDLWRHRVRRPTSAALNLHLIPYVFGKSKISNFDVSVGDEYILKLEITMNEILSLKYIHSLKHLFKIS